MEKTMLYKKVWKRAAAWLLVAACLLTALPRGARALDAKDAVGVSVNIEVGESSGRGVASLVTGNDKTYFTIVAAAKKGYVFSHWIASGGYSGTFYGSQLTMPYARNTANTDYVKVDFVAYFRPIDSPIYGVQVMVDTNQLTWGAVSGGKRVTDDRTEVSTTISATPNDGYVFSYWSSDKSTAKYYTSTMSVYAEPGQLITYEAHFAEIATGATGVFTAVAGYNAAGDYTPGLGGTATGDMAYSHSGAATQQTVLQAFPATNGYVFSHWARIRDDETTATEYTANPLTVTVENHRDVYTAVFKAVEQANGVFVGTPLLQSGGTISPDNTVGTASGSQLYNPNAGKYQQTVLQAFPSSNQYMFSYWAVEEAGATSIGGYKQVSTANPYTLEVPQERFVVYPVFIETPTNTPLPGPSASPGTSPFPVKPENFKDVWRKFTSPSYGTTRESLSDLAKSVIDGVRSRYASADPDVGSSNAVAMLEEQLDEKTAQKAKDRDEMQNLPEATLVTSDGETCETDRVTTGDYVDVANELVTARFGSLYDYEILQCVHAQGPVGEEKREQTMVWKNTGAAYKDRLLLIQFLPNGTHSIVTPIADEDGTLTFTLTKPVTSDFLLLKIYLMPVNQ